MNSNLQADIKDFKSNGSPLMFKYTFVFLAFLIPLSLFAKADLPEITAKDVVKISNEILAYHTTYKELSTELIKRTLKNYLEELDPKKTYFIKSEIITWLEPSEQKLKAIMEDYKNESYKEFFQIHKLMEQATKRFNQLNEQINNEALNEEASPEEFKDLQWVDSEEKLLERHKKIRAIQLNVSKKLEKENKEKFFLRIKRQIDSRHAQFLLESKLDRERFIYSNILKAFAQSLDNQTMYFTPGEASAYIINVQKRLFGIGAALRDDLNGLTVTQIAENGPSAKSKLLKLKDRIVAVNGESIIGMEQKDAINLIRGEEGSSVTLTIVREKTVADSDESSTEQKKEEILDITIVRGEVIFKETRFDKEIEPYGDGVIACIKLYSFYQTPSYSSSKDILETLVETQKKHKIKGIILDLRYNTGGMIYQAVEVIGLFIRKGITATIRDHNGKLNHLRNLKSGPFLDTPLIVLTSRYSASASEVVAQSLQDFGRAILVGDDHSYGKGTYQLFTLVPDDSNHGKVNPQGEYKVTAGKWYTVSGKTPQLTGVFSDVVVSGLTSELEKGEKYAKCPIENDTIKDHYDDDFSDLPLLHRIALRQDYKSDPQEKITTFSQYIPMLKSNSSIRLQEDQVYQNFITELKKEDFDIEKILQYNQSDLQLTEAKNIMKDFISLLTTESSLRPAI